MTKTSTAKKAEGTSKKPDVQHSFLRHDSDQKAVVPVLRLVARHLVGGIRATLEPIAGSKIQVDTPEPEFSVFESWCGQQDELVSLTRMQMAPMKGRILMSLDPAMIGTLVDAFFGGSVREYVMRKKEFGQTDLRLIDRIGGGMAERIGQAWSEIAPFTCAMAGHSTNIDTGRSIATNARIIIQRFRLTFVNKVRFEIEIVYPLEALQSIDHLLEAGAASAENSDPVWRDKMAESLANISMPARSVLARPVLTLPQLAALKPGDIIPIPPARNLPLLIGDRVFARGSLGEQNGLAAFKIEHIEKGNAR